MLHLQLFVAHNKLSGTIPSSLQSKTFAKLDLSYNKFRGTAHDFRFDNDTDGSLVLEVNRLSGRFPTVGNGGTAKLNALRGNLFSCHNIPETDISHADYTCGSEDLDASLILYAIVYGIIFFIVLLMLIVRPEYASKIPLVREISILLRCIPYYLDYEKSLVKSLSSSTQTCRICSFFLDLGDLAKAFMLLVVVQLMISAPFYGLKFSEHGINDPVFNTHSYQYRWRLSFAFVRGVLPAVLVLLMWISVAFILVAIAVVMKIRRMRDKTGPSSEGRSTAEASNLGYRDHVSYGLLFSLNLAINGVVNGTFVYLSNQSFSPVTSLSIQGAVALFNVMWNMSVVPVLSQRMIATVHVAKTELILLVFNNIIIPCIAASFTSPACFQVSEDFVALLAVQLWFNCHFNRGSCFCRTKYLPSIATPTVPSRVF